MIVFICILSACGLTMFSIFGFLSQDPEWMEDHAQFAAWGWTMAFVLMYFNNTLICWLYSLKQWYISISIPR